MATSTNCMDSQRMPDSDSTRTVFPLNWSTMTYDFSKFTISQVDNHCTLTDIEEIIRDISISTDNLQPIGVSRRIISRSMILLLFVLIARLIMMSVSGQTNNSQNYISNNCNSSGCDSSTNVYFWLTTALVIPTLLVVFVTLCRYRQQWRLMRARIVEVFDKHRGKFYVNGLRWEAPGSPTWIELWNDYRQGMGSVQMYNTGGNQQQFANSGLQPLNSSMSYDKNANVGYSSQQEVIKNSTNSNYNHGQSMVNTTSNYGAGSQGYNVNIAL